MATFQEILAAKKKAAAAGTEQAPKPNQPAQPKQEATKAPVEEIKAVEAKKPLTLQEKLALAKQASATPAKSEAPTKPLSFAEKIALQRASQPVSKTFPVQKAEEKEEALEILQDKIIAEASKPKQPKDIPIVTDDVEVQQAYASIREKINDLDDLIGDDLKNGMASLKRALMANPNACEQMLDEDIGEMVKALRRMTLQDVIEVKETGSGKKKPKAKSMADMTPEQLAQGLAEL